MSTDEWWLIYTFLSIAMIVGGYYIAFKRPYVRKQRKKLGKGEIKRRAITTRMKQDTRTGAALGSEFGLKARARIIGWFKKGNDAPENQ